MAKDFDNAASILTVQTLYGLIAHIAASLYFGYMWVFARLKVNMPMLVWQFLGAHFQAFTFQSIGTVIDSNPGAESCSRPPYVKQSASVASNALSVSAQKNPCNVHTGLCRTKTTDASSEQDCDNGMSHEGAIEVVDLANVVPNASIDSVQPHVDGSTVCPGVADLGLVESVKGLEGLKAALAARFMADPNTLPDSFRRGYVVDLNQHWISVHVLFDRSQSLNSLSLIVFDTLEVNYQRYHQVGLLRSSITQADTEKQLTDTAPNLWWGDGGADVVTLCSMLGIKYDISFLAPICDMRRLTWEEEDSIRTENKGSSSKSTVYYDQRGNPFRKIIVQPILQAEQDGTCKSRALAVLSWLLKLDEKALAWYVASHRELFQVELRPAPDCAGDKGFSQAREPRDSDDAEDKAIFGSLMATGKRDKFGRDHHMKVCHSETLRYNRNVDEICTDALQRGPLPAHDSEEALLLGESREASLRRRREEELSRIRAVLGQSPEGGLCFPSDSGPSGGASHLVDESCVCSSQRWRAIEDHEARWQFLEETCFFGHNLGFRKIKRMYPRDEVLVKELPAVGAASAPEAGSANGIGAPSAGEDGRHGFGDTKYLRKYIVPSTSGNYITHEADPMFHKPLENFFEFLCRDDEHENVVVPFYVLPFPGSFMGLSLDDYVQGNSLVILDLEGDPDEHSRKKVSDFSLPTGNNFLNDPISYNKAIANVSLPVKITA